MEAYPTNAKAHEVADIHLRAGKLANIDWLGRGYNIYKGNPKSEGTYDPGFSGEIFKFEYSTPEQIAPDKVQHLEGDTCALEFHSQTITGETALMNSLTQ